MKAEPPDADQPGSDPEAQAARWLARRDRGFSADEWLAYQAWLRLDRRHGAAVEEMSRSWRALDDLRALAADSTVAPDPDLLLGPRPGKRRRLVLPWMAAAAAVLLVLAGGWPLRKPASARAAAPGPVPVPVVASEELALPDGSVADLNQGAKIAVAFTPAERRVRLLRGEATFSVTHNPARPFLVEANGVVVRAVGTVFNVRLAPGAVEVLVAEGKVRVTPPVVPTFNSALPLLTAGHRALVPLNASGGPAIVETVTHEQMENLLAWRDPRLVFTGQSLAQVAAEFNRYNRHRLVIADAVTGAVRIGGSFRANHVMAFVRLLGNFGVEAREEDGAIVLRRAAP